MAPVKKNKSSEILQIRPYNPPGKQKEQEQQPETSSSAPKPKPKPKKTTPATIVVEDQGNDDDEDEKKSRGSWTSEKQLVLLQKYAEHFPPGAPWGKSTEAWQKIVDSVNAVAPNDTPLRYDACRRAVDKISERYIEEATIRKAALDALSLRDKHDDEKAEKLLKQESKRERKRMKRVIIQKLAEERTTEHLKLESTVANQNEDNNEGRSSSSAPPQASAAPADPITYIYLDDAYVKEQREFQHSILGYMEKMQTLLQGMHETLKEISKK